MSRSGLVGAVRTWRTILAATGAGTASWLLVLALGITVVWHDGTIDRIGPLSLSPVMHVMVAVPALLAVACAVSHLAPRTPVVVRGGRTTTARVVSYVTVLGAGALVLALGDTLASSPTLGASARNLLLFSALALATAGLAGVAYAWVPVLLVLGSAVLSPADPAWWSLHAWVMAQTAEPVHVVIAGAACAASVAVAAADPLARASVRRYPAVAASLQQKPSGCGRAAETRAAPQGGDARLPQGAARAN